MYDCRLVNKNGGLIITAEESYLKRFITSENLVVSENFIFKKKILFHSKFLDDLVLDIRT